MSASHTETPSPSSPFARAASAHDTLSHVTFIVGAVLCGYIAVSLCYEIAVRYLFSQPTRWANPFSNFAVCIAIFAALPELTRRRAHISVNILLERAPARFASILNNIILIVSAVTCFAAAWICANETWGQFQGNVQTIAAIEVPKWTITIFIAYGLASAGIYFLRELFVSLNGRRIAP